MSSFEEEMKGRESLLDAADYEPPRGRRSYWKSNSTGQRAYVVRKGGQTMLKLDHGADGAVLPLVHANWTPDKEELPLFPDHVNRICFEADKAFCAVVSLWQRSRQEWGALTHEQRAGWARIGPPDGDPRRKGLFLLIKYFLSGTDEAQGRLLKFVQEEIDGSGAEANVESAAGAG